MTDEHAIEAAAAKWATKQVARDPDRHHWTAGMEAEKRNLLAQGFIEGAAYRAARSPADGDAVARVKAILDYDSEPHARDYVETIVAAARGSSTPEQPAPDRQAEQLPSATLTVQYGEMQPGSSDPMPPERRAMYQRRIEAANKRHRIDPTLRVGEQATPEQPDERRRRRFRYVHLTATGPQFALADQGWGDDVRGLTEDEEYFGIKLVPEQDYNALVEQVLASVSVSASAPAEPTEAATQAAFAAWEKKVGWNGTLGERAAFLTGYRDGVAALPEPPVPAERKAAEQ